MGILFTNQTTSSQKNDVPMSYSSTNSKGYGYLHNRFQRLNHMDNDGVGSSSPITITDNENVNEMIMERYQQSDARNNPPIFQNNPRLSIDNTSVRNIHQSSTKKSVKFIDENNYS